MEDADIQLISLIAQGQESALREFYNKYEHTVYSFAMNRLGNEFEAADCLNEVMLEVWKHAGRFEGRSKVRTWLFGIANYKIINQLRKRYRQAGEELDEQMPDEDSVQALEVLALADDAEIVRRCVDGLSDNHRQIIHLAFFEDLTYEEIAVIAGCPEGTVKTRVFHAKQKLKECLSRNDVGMH
jgi:RNA polymerase sigma-70 factor (ECF subfamily)